MKNKKLLWITSAVTLLPILAGIVLWNRLPERMPIHFGASGQADGWSGKALAVLGLPMLMLAAQWLMFLLTKLDRKSWENNAKIMHITLWIVPVLSLVTNGMVYSAALDAQWNITRIMLVLMGRWRRVRRGDVIICRYPGRGRRFFVKRAVGVPGDEISRTGGVTLLNGESLDARAYVYRSEYQYTLGEDEYFCVGDNRANSHDSRDWQRMGANQVGPISRKRIYGVAKRVIWPPAAWKAIGRGYAFEGVPPVADTEEPLPDTETITEGGDTNGNQKAD